MASLMVIRDKRPEAKREKPKTRQRRTMKSPFCMPRLRGNTCTRKSNRLSPMSLIDRLREAVFRLIMLSALSKATHESRSSNSQRPYCSHDPYSSEAVADCIEFIKKSATTDENRDSTASSSIDVATGVAIPVPAM
ncbi:unnamed protein product [Ilex paraguariensis]|uniref:Uncharacterized protein n=1 Tax=Ilex paraguariensis TaxID=185542 RepID=A0ABC8SP98_9AQUA